MDIDRKTAIAQGLLSYSLGRPCRNNHLPVKRYSSNGSCMQCMFDKRNAPETKAIIQRNNKAYHDRPDIAAKRHARYASLKTDPVIWAEYRKNKSECDRAYREHPDNKERLLQQSRDYYHTRPGVKERAAEQERERWKDPVYRQTHLDYARERHSRPEVKERNKFLAQERARANPELHRAASANRRAARNLRTPTWSDLKKIRVIYKECVGLCVEYGTEFEVDHIVPLVGTNVSGLHVWWNLQSIPACENNSKSNRFTEQDAEGHGIWYGADYYVNGWTWSNP